MLLSRFEVELDESMGGVEGMLERQCNTFTVSIDKVQLLMLAHALFCRQGQARNQRGKPA